MAGKKERYIQVGETALRDPVTKEFLPSVPLYIKAEGGAVESQEELIADIGAILARKFREYKEGCERAGVTA